MYFQKRYIDLCWRSLLKLRFLKNIYKLDYLTQTILLLSPKIISQILFAILIMGVKATAIINAHIIVIR